MRVSGQQEEEALKLADMTKKELEQLEKVRGTGLGLGSGLG